MSTKKQTYAHRVAEIASKIKAKAEYIANLEQTRAEWLRPDYKVFQFGGHSYKVVLPDGKVNPPFAGIQREALAIHDGQLLKANSELEGMRWKLLQLGKEGSTHERT